MIITQIGLVCADGIEQVHTGRNFDAPTRRALIKLSIKVWCACSVRLVASVQ
jgi:hypothetical protein